MLSLSIASPSTIIFSPKPHIPIPKSSSSSSSSSFNGVKIQKHIRVPPQRVSFSPSSSVVMMSKRLDEMKEIRTKTTEEINEEVVDLKGELLMLRLQKSARNEFKSSEFGRMRKRVLFISFSFLFCFFKLWTTCFCLFYIHYCNIEMGIVSFSWKFQIFLRFSWWRRIHVNDLISLLSIYCRPHDFGTKALLLLLFRPWASYCGLKILF